MLKEYTYDDFKTHNNEKEGYWLLMDGLIYDVTPFKKHPGQFSILEKHAGTDVTKKFNDIHSTEAREMRKKFLIGKLKVGGDNYEVKNVIPESNVPKYYYALPVLVFVVLLVVSLRNNSVI